MINLSSITKNLEITSKILTCIKDIIEELTDEEAEKSEEIISALTQKFYT